MAGAGPSSGRELWTSVVWVLGVFGLVVLAAGTRGVAVLLVVVFVWALASEWFPTGDDDGETD